MRRTSSRALESVTPATVVLASLLWSLACSPRGVDDAALAGADADHANWLTYGRTYSEQRHSPLVQIDEETVDRLGLAWYADMATIRGLEATPLIVDVVIYETCSWIIMQAFDAATVEHKWS